MESDFIFDRGPAEHFHGRTEIIDTFNSALKAFRKKKKGTTFLIQGAPGAGKTALLDVLAQHAKKRGWKTAHITPNALWNPQDLFPILKKRRGRQINRLGAGADIGNIGAANVSVGIETPAHTIIRLLQKQRKPLLLILDEAQILGLKGGIPDDMKSVAISVLKQIHNGDLGKPVMFLAGGLGTTEPTLTTLGISRFMRRCKVPLGCLSKESTCAVIRDFLIHEGGISKPPLKWIETIAERTHGWPQHIVSYADPAAKYLASHRSPTDDGLNMVLQQGRAEQIEYYDQRAHELDEHKREALAIAVIDVPVDGTMTSPAIKSSLKKSGLTQKEADSLFTLALDKGIIDKRKGGRYGIPIPSMHRWLIEEYGKGKSQDVQPPTKGSPPPTGEDQERVKKDKDDGEGKGKDRGGFSMER